MQKRLLAREPFFCAILFFFPADKIGQGKSLIRAVGIGGAMGRQRRPLDLPHDVVDGPAVFGQVGLDHGVPVWQNGAIDLSPAYIYTQGSAV